MIIPNQKIKIKWNSKHKKYYESIKDIDGNQKYFWSGRNKEFEVDLIDIPDNSKVKVEATCDNCQEVYYANYCSVKANKTYCSNKCRQLGSRKTIEVSCCICAKKLYRRPSDLSKNKGDNVFCSNECVGKYNTMRHQKNRVSKNCLICNKKYSVKPSEANRSVTCSRECQKIWQSKYLIGINASNFDTSIPLEKRKTECRWCNKELKLFPYQVRNIEENQAEYFCSIDCKREWYAKVWSQTEEWKIKSRENVLYMLENGLFGTDSSCQIKINEILDTLNINYQNEYNCKYFAIDNYLQDHNLMIEVMGTFWHCDPRFYNEINYQNQIDRIISDKRKRSYIKNEYNVNILYLWEEDINNNIDLVIALIKKYINKKGNLKDYNSFNYTLDYDNNLSISKTLITPYMDFHISKLNEITKIRHNKKDRRQIDKWITFNCDNCGKPKEQLIAHYKNSTTHCCSYKCAYELKRKLKKR